MDGHISSAVATGLALSILLAGCGSLAESLPPAPTADPTTSAGPSLDKNVASTCVGLSVAVTSLTSVEQLIHAGELSVDDRAPVTRVVSASLFALSSQPDIGLKAELDALIAAEAPGGPPLVGASFDPSSAEFKGALGELRDACEANRTPLILWSAIVGG